MRIDRDAAARPTETVPMTTPHRHSPATLVAFAQSLLVAAGMPADRATAVAEVLVEGDLLGHTTHGLQLLAPYLADIDRGAMKVDGEPTVISDHGAAVAWDGGRLPGPWLVRKAIDLALDRAAQFGTCTLTIAHSHHIACLAAYLAPVAERGMLILLTCSDPAMKSVVPFGGTRPLYTPNPFAAGFPTTGDPVMLDVSMSTTTNGMVGRKRAAGELFDHPWLVDGNGEASRDPAAVSGDTPGGILPLGGMDSGHKGFALGLLVEALTAGLGGTGRADNPSGWGASVFLQIIDPAAFGGRDAFRRETGWFADAARANPTRPGGPAVRMPGEAGLRRRREQLRDGVTLHPAILPALAPWAARFGLDLPAADTGAA